MGKGYKVLTPDLFGLGSNFSIENIHNELIKRIDGRKPDLIAGISLGGIIMPYIAKDYPDAKLIFIATGSSLKAESPLFNLFIKLSKYKSVLKLTETILKLPVRVIASVYKLANPFHGTPEEKKEYEDDMYININFIKGIPVSKEIEIVKFVSNADSSEILGKLKNHSLIFNGKHDLFMPEERGASLHRLLKNSELIVNDGEHFDVFTKKDLAKVDEFLSDL